MDPLQFIWEVTQAVSGLVAAVVLPVGALWFIARRARAKRPDRPAGTAAHDRLPPTSGTTER